mmetsp:Transcript_10081/g.17563  ORF Transcript_10081/g.17563 Transcript_10081/m.17563 type:complete len:153 (-) Transcript_10081:535-993(-)
MFEPTTARGTEPVTRDLLAKNVTIARFSQTKDRPCHFRTSLCPNDCGHAATVAEFSIERYLEYEKPGEYGDDKTAIFCFDMKRQQGNGPAAASQEVFTQKVQTLQPGDWVRLSWLHEYVHDNGGHFPERPVTQLEQIDALEAQQCMAATTQD